MPRFAKKNSTRIDILKKMFSELKKNHESECVEINEVEIKDIPDFESLKEDDYNELIESYLYEVAYNDKLPAFKDVRKINFDFENCFVDEEAAKADLNHLQDGTALLWAYAGGDWEMPVAFVLYLDPNNKIRGYVPSDGNVYCHECKTAWGSCDCGSEEPEEEPEFDYPKMYADVCNRIQTK
jgi:hypothetical protein